MMKRIVILLLIFSFFLTNAIRASHIAGGDISYTYLGNNQYQINLNLFVDCLGFDPGDQQEVDFTSTCGGTLTTFVNVTNPGGTEISQLCAQQIGNSTCNGGNLPGMWVFHYIDTVTISPNCDTWTMSWSTCCRNGAIINLDSPDSQGSYLEATLNSATDSTNSSPYFTSQPIPYVCANQTVNYSYGVVEQDGDSLHYSLISAMDGAGSNLAYSNGYSPASPIPGISIDPNTGALSFTPTTIGNFVVVVLVEEFNSNGQLVGSSMRDIQFVVQNCGNNVPDPSAGAITNLTGAAVQTGPFAIQLCEGISFTFDATFTDPDPTDSLRVVSNIATVLPGATLTTSGSNPMTITVDWTAPPGSANTNTSFSVTVNDGACPVVGQQTFVYDVNVEPRTLAGPDKIICGTQTATLNATGGTVFVWSVIDGHPMVIGNNFSCDTCANPVASPDSTTTYEVVSNLSGTCVSRDTVTVFVVPDFTFSTMQTTDTLCFQQTVQLGVSGSPTGIYTYQWTPATYLDTATIATPTVTATTPGTYNYQIAITSPFGCLKKDTLTVTVLPEIRTYGFADTILCLTQSANLSALGGTTFNWSVISGSPITVGNNFTCNPCASALATPAISTVYQVTSNLGGTCINKDTINVTVVPNYTTIATPTDTITCLLQPPIPISVTASPGGTYTYSWSPAQYLNDSTIANPIANITSPGVHNFIATITNSDGCVRKDTATITITPSYKPDPIAYANTAPFCLGDTVHLGVTFNVTTPASCGTTTVGCGASLTAVIGTGTGTNTSTSYPAPYGNWYTNSRQQYLFRASELNAMGITGGKIDQIDFNVTQNTGITTYHQYTINMGCTSQTALSTMISGLSNVFTPQTINIANGWNAHLFTTPYEWDGVSNLVIEICFSEGIFNYTDNAITTITNTSFVSTLYNNSDTGPVCTDATFVQSSNSRPNVRFHYCGSAPDSTVYTYSWYQPGTVNNATVQYPTSILNTAGTEHYFVVVTDTVSGCYDTAYIDATANSPTALTIHAFGDTTVCPGTPAALMATGAENYTWSPNIALTSTNTDTTTANPTTTVTYVVTGTSACTTGPAHDSVTVNVLNAQALVVNAGGDQEVCGTTFNLSGSVSGGYGSNIYGWTIASGSTTDSIHNANMATASVTPTEENTNVYQLMVTDFCGDTASDYVSVHVLMDCKLNIPNVFTPNGDGKNDAFLVGGVGMKSYSIAIYDRWGKKVYESTDIKDAWTGKGHADGTYYYIIQAESLTGKQFNEQGYLQLLGH